jgi:TFIIF-interacting CTD phosphatase-like protein
MSLCIINDLDGTLIDDDNNPRPFLSEYLEYCFKHFKVAVWTAASLEHYNDVYGKVLAPILQKLDVSFHFVYTGEKCTNKPDIQAIYNGDFYARPVVVKCLKKVWKAYSKDGFTRHSTLIVDDTSQTYSRNYGNAISAPTYSGDPNDRFLKALIAYLDSIDKIYQETGTIRHRQKISFHEN